MPQLPELPWPAAEMKHRRTLGALHAMEAPIALVRLVAAVIGHQAFRKALQQEIEFVEFFAGDGNVTAAVRANGKVSASYDLRYGTGMDFTTEQGFANAIVLVLQLKAGGASILGPPCSSFVWMNSGTSRRSKVMPLGDQSQRSVRKANGIASRLALLVTVLHAAGAAFVMEQPQSSLLEYHPRVQQVAFMLSYILMAWNCDCVHVHRYGVDGSKLLQCVIVCRSLRSSPCRSNGFACRTLARRPESQHCCTPTSLACSKLC